MVRLWWGYAVPRAGADRATTLAVSGAPLLGIRSITGDLVVGCQGLQRGVGT